jgi:hypothetical protein
MDRSSRFRVHGSEFLCRVPVLGYLFEVPGSLFVVLGLFTVSRFRLSSGLYQEPLNLNPEPSTSNPNHEHEP